MSLSFWRERGGRWEYNDDDDNHDAAFLSGVNDCVRGGNAAVHVESTRGEWARLFIWQQHRAVDKTTTYKPNGEGRTNICPERKRNICSTCAAKHSLQLKRERRTDSHFLSHWKWKWREPFRQQLQPEQVTTQRGEVIARPGFINHHYQTRGVYCLDNTAPESKLSDLNPF